MGFAAGAFFSSGAGKDGAASDLRFVLGGPMSSSVSVSRAELARAFAFEIIADSWESAWVLDLFGAVLAFFGGFASIWSSAVSFASPSEADSNDQ